MHAHGQPAKHVRKHATMLHPSRRPILFSREKEQRMAGGHSYFKLCKISHPFSVVQSARKKNQNYSKRHKHDRRVTFHGHHESYKVSFNLHTITYAGLPLHRREQTPPHFRVKLSSPKYGKQVKIRHTNCTCNCNFSTVSEWVQFRPARHNIRHFGRVYTLGVLYISYSVMDDQWHK